MRIVPVLLLWVSVLANAQMPLDQESIVEVGMCYSQCLNAYRERDIAGEANTDRGIDIAITIRGTSSAYIPRADKPDLLASIESLIYTETCLHNQRIMREIDLCRASCQDMELAYSRSLLLSGERSVDYSALSTTKQRFEFLYNLLHDQLIAAGLWTTYDQPVEGDVFARACNTFLGLEQPQATSLMQALENLPLAEE